MVLQDQLVIVVGGTSGMGLATVQASLDAGARVVLTGRSIERAKATASRLGTGRAPGSVRGAAAELGDPASITALAKEFGGADHVYVAAGSTKLAGPLADEPLDGLLRAFDDRIKGSVRLVRAFAPAMRAGGSFVFTGGLSTDRPVKGAWVSGLGTAGAEQLARVLALELAPIRFNAVSPGWTDTPMWDEVLGEHKASVLAEVSAKWVLPRLVTASEVAGAVLFLMANRAITGEVLHIDGGQRLS